MPCRIKDVRPRDEAAPSPAPGDYPDWPRQVTSTTLPRLDSANTSLPQATSLTATRHTTPPTTPPSSMPPPPPKDSNFPLFRSIDFPRKDASSQSRPNLLEADATSSSSRSTIETQSKIIEGLRADKSAIRQELASYKEGLASYKEQVKFYKDEVTSYKEEVTTYNEEVKSYKHELATYREALGKTQQVASAIAADRDGVLRREKELRAIVEKATTREQENMRMWTRDLEKWKQEALEVMGQNMARLVYDEVMPIVERCNKAYEYSDSLMWARERAVLSSDEDKEVMRGKMECMKKTMDAVEENAAGILQKQKMTETAMQTGGEFQSKLDERLAALEASKQRDSRDASEAQLAVEAKLGALQDQINTKTNDGITLGSSLERELKNVQDDFETVKRDVENIHCHLQTLENDLTEVRREESERVTLDKKVRALQNSINSIETSGVKAQLALETAFKAIEAKVKDNADDESTKRSAMNYRLDALEKLTENLDGERMAQFALETRLNGTQNDLKLVRIELQGIQPPVSRLDDVENQLRHVRQLLDATNFKFAQSSDIFTSSDEKIRNVLDAFVTWANTATRALQNEVVTTDPEQIHISILAPQMAVLNSWITHLSKSQHASGKWFAMSQTTQAEKHCDQLGDTASATQLRITSSHTQQETPFNRFNSHSTPPATPPTVNKSFTRAETSHDERASAMGPSTDTSQQQLGYKTIEPRKTANFLPADAPVEVSPNSTSVVTPIRASIFDIESEPAPCGSSNGDQVIANVIKDLSWPRMSTESSQTSMDVYEEPSTPPASKSADSRKRTCDAGWAYEPRDKGLKRIKTPQRQSYVLKLRVPNLGRKLELMARHEGAILVARPSIVS